MSFTVCVCVCVCAEGNRVGEAQKLEMARVAAEREKQMDSIARIKAQQRMEVRLLGLCCSPCVCSPAWYTHTHACRYT